MRPHLLCVVLLIGVSAYAATPAYHVIELQSMVPGSSTEPTGINASGDTVGTSVTADDRSNLSPETALDLVRRILAAIPLNQGTRNSLKAKLDAAAQALAKGNRNTAANVLQAMLHEIDAQTGKGIAEADARGLRITVQSVLERL